MDFYKPHYAVVIIGGGPAGMASALQLQAKGVKPTGARSFAGADFWPGKAKLAENTVVLSRALTKHGLKSARQNRYVFVSRQLKVPIM